MPVLAATSFPPDAQELDMDISRNHFTELCTKLDAAINSMAETMFASMSVTAAVSDTGESARALFSIDQMIDNYGIMYHLLHYYDDRFDEVQETMKTGIQRSLRCAYEKYVMHAGEVKETSVEEEKEEQRTGGTSLLHDTVEFILRARYWCRVMETMFEPYTTFLKVYRCNQSSRQGMDIERLFHMQIARLLKSQWNALCRRVYIVVEEYCKDLHGDRLVRSANVSPLVCYLETMDRCAHATNCASQAIDDAEKRLHEAYLTARDAPVADAAPPSAIEPQHETTIYTLTTLSMHADLENAMQAEIPVMLYKARVHSSRCVQLAQLLSALRAYLPQELAQLVRDLDKHAEDRTKAYVLSSSNVFELQQLSEEYVRALFVEWRVQAVIYSCFTVPLRSSDEIVKHMSVASVKHMLHAHCATILQETKFPELYEACVHNDVARLKECITCTGVLQKVFHISPTTVGAFYERHLRKAFRENVTNIRITSDLQAFSSLIHRTFACIDAINIVQPEKRTEHLYYCDKKWFQSWFMKWIHADPVKMQTGSEYVFTTLFEESFFVIWLESLLQLPLPMFEEYCPAFFRLFRALPNKDVFLDIYMKLVRKRFIHRGFDALRDNLIHLNLDSIIGPHPLLHQLQSMISEQHFSPMCWQGSRGHVLSHANWKGLPLFVAPVHPVMQERLDGYALAYGVNYPDRELEWVLYYSWCKLRIMESTVVCSMITGSALLFIIDHKDGDAFDVLCEKGFDENCARFWCDYLTSHGLLRQSNGKTLLSNCMPLHCNIPLPSKRLYKNCLEKDKSAVSHDHKNDKETLSSATEYQVLADRAHAVRAALVNVLKHSETGSLHVESLFDEVRTKIRCFVLERSMFQEQLTRIITLGYARECESEADEGNVNVATEGGEDGATEQFVEEDNGATEGGEAIVSDGGQEDETSDANGDVDDAEGDKFRYEWVAYVP